MRTTIDTAIEADVLYVAKRMRERDVEEFLAVSNVANAEELAEALARQYGSRDDAICAKLNGEPVCIGLTIESRPNVITLGFFATDKFPSVALRVTKFVRRLFDKYEQAGVHRFEAVSIDGYAEAHRWLEILGLHAESGIMRGYGRNKEAFVQFARVVE